MEAISWISSVASWTADESFNRECRKDRKGAGRSPLGCVLRGMPLVSDIVILTTKQTASNIQVAVLL